VSTESRPFDPVRVPLSGKTLVEASAGTGKTHAITTLFLRLVVEQERLPSEILVVTFTEAATAELRGRIRRALL
jgi:exodeoxyribonuclease V beta subunit